MIDDLIRKIYEGKFSEADVLFEKEMAHLSLDGINDIQESLVEDSIKLYEKIKFPDGFEQFIEVAKKAKDGNDFVKMAQKMKGIPNSTSQWFRDKYDPEERLSMAKASQKFIDDVKKGLYEDMENSHYAIDEAKRIIKVNSRGEKRIKKQCPKGQKLQGGACKPISGSDKITSKKAHKKASRTKKAGGAGAKRRQQFKAKKAKKKRKAFGL